MNNIYKSMNYKTREMILYSGYGPAGYVKVKVSLNILRSCLVIPQTEKIGGLEGIKVNFNLLEIKSPSIPPTPLDFPGTE